MSPFGAIDHILPDKGQRSLAGSRETKIPPLDPANKKKIYISVVPDRQMWHQRSDLSLNIVDHEGVPEDHELVVMYNNLNVTNRFLRQAKVEYQEAGHSVRYDFHDLRLRAVDRNQIVFHYRRKPAAETKIYHYQEPICQLDESRMIANVSPFSPEQGVLDTVHSVARRKGFSASFVAGLIAQESGFNASAVSWAKAIGLTQITDLAAQHIVAKHPDWPQYRPAERMSAPLLKAKIITGSINAANEWRLDEEKSILGSLEFIEYLQSYWQQPENHRLLRENLLDNSLAMGEVLLASYNSGAYRVKRSLRENGRRWLEGAELNEARRYVRRVRSYCYHFNASPPTVAYLWEDL